MWPKEKKRKYRTNLEVQLKRKRGVEAL